MPAVKGLSQLLVLLFSAPFDLSSTIFIQNKLRKERNFDLVGFCFNYKPLSVWADEKGKKQMTILFCFQSKKYLSVE